MSRFVLLLSGLLWSSVWAEMLTLDQALATLDARHPAIQEAQAQTQAAQANYQRATSANDLRIDLSARLQYLQPAELSNFREHNDSQAALRAEKRLYDFGYSQAREAAAQARLKAAEWELLDAWQRQYLHIMEAFFQVLLADLEYQRDNEALSIAYVRLDKLREKHRLGQVSELELLQKESLYEQLLSRRAETENKQRHTRLRLALAMNRPDEIPDRLQAPPPPNLQAPLPDVEQWYAKIRHNPKIKALEQRIQAAKQTLLAAQKRNNPVIKGEIGAYYYNRETRATAPFNAALVLEVPLYTGGRSRADTQAARAQLNAQEAQKAKLEHELRQQLLMLWLEQKQLQRKAQALQTREAYRDLYLDRSRSLYEMERASDLGDALVQITKVRLEQARLNYQWRLNQTRIQALTGELRHDAFP